ncbi:MAG TPA: RNA polymerase sigma factor [Frankiaceae bacterium]|nr:RNA polymerase sigma factor [Frankiaceae bacterium]
MPTRPFDAHAQDVSSAVIHQREQLLRVICSLTGLDEHGAEDVLSKVTERVLKNGLAPKQGKSWFTYMCEACRNEASNERRSAERAADREVAAFQLSGADVAVDTVAARMVWLDAMADLDRLPELERRVFLMRYLFDSTHAEIAEAAGITVGGVQSRLRQAHERLRRMQEEREKTPPYLLLIAALASMRRAPAATPPLVAVAGVAVLSVVAVLAAPVPRLGLAEFTNVPVHRIIADGHRDGSVRSPGPSRGAGQPPAAAAAASPAAQRSVPRLGVPNDGLVGNLPSVEACAGPACVSTDENAVQPGDQLRVHRVGIRGSQRVTPLCWAIPDNDELECRTSEPDDYYVHPPRQEHHPVARKSKPSAPMSEEPPKGPLP